MPPFADPHALWVFTESQALALVLAHLPEPLDASCREAIQVALDLHPNSEDPVTKVTLMAMRRCLQRPCPWEVETVQPPWVQIAFAWHQWAHNHPDKALQTLHHLPKTDGNLDRMILTYGTEVLRLLVSGPPIRAHARFIHLLDLSASVGFEAHQALQWLYCATYGPVLDR